MRRLAKKTKIDNVNKTPVKFQTGDLVFIESLKVTKPRHGVNQHMKEMVKQEFFIDTYELHRSKNVMTAYIRDLDNESRWAFAPEDLKLIAPWENVKSKAMPSKKMLFDPAELI